MPIRLGQRLGLERGALMHGIGAEEAIKVARTDPLYGQCDCTDCLGKAAFGVLCQQETVDTARRVLQRRSDGVKSKEAKWPIMVGGQVFVVGIVS